MSGKKEKQKVHGPNRRGKERGQEKEGTTFWEKLVTSTVGGGLESLKTQSSKGRPHLAQFEKTGESIGGDTGPRSCGGE